MEGMEKVELRRKIKLMLSQASTSIGSLSFEELLHTGARIYAFGISFSSYWPWGRCRVEHNNVEYHTPFC